MTPLETLRAARQLITDPAKWTHGGYARDADGNDVAPEDGDAVCFCAYGAIANFCGLNEDLDPFKCLADVCLRKFGQSVIDLNDTRTHAEVLALFDAAIAELEGV